MDSSTDQLTAEELRRQLDEHRAGIGNDLVAIGDRVSPKRMTERRTVAVRQRMGGVRDAVMGAKDSVVDEAGDMGDRAGAAGGSLGDRAAGAAEQVKAGPEMARRQTQGNPLAAGLVAFGAGLLAATVVPQGRREQQWVDERVQPQLTHAAEQAGRAAQETMEAVKPAAQEAESEVKEEARQAATDVKDEARRAGTEVTEQARQQADEVPSG